MSDETVHCNTCNLDFKNDKFYKKHANTSRHILRATNSDIITFGCVCGKTYSYQQSLYVHRKQCVQYQKLKTENLTQFESVSLQVKQLQKENKEIRDKLILYEKEHDSLKVQIAKEREEMKVRHASYIKRERDSKLATQQQQHNIKSRDNRKKINKDTRKLIADNQENVCGECKLALSPYFQIDHIIGLQFGGTHDESNLMALCCECHAIKSIKENKRRKQIKDAIQTILRGSSSPLTP